MLGRFPQRVWSPLALAGLLLGSRWAPAQDALRNALLLDRTLSPPINTNSAVSLAPDQPHLGPARYTVGVYAGAEYNDNVFYAPSAPRPDTILRGGLAPGIFWQVTDNSAINLSGRVGYSFYLDNPQLDYLDIAPDSALTWDVGFEDGTLSFFEMLDYSHSVATEPAFAGLASYARLDNTVGGRVTWLPGHWFLQAGYSHQDFSSDTTGLSYLDRATEDIFGRAAWRLAEATQGGMEASVSVTRYAQQLQNNYLSLSVGPYIEWQVTKAINASLHGGPALYSFDATPYQAAYQLSSYYFSVDVRHQLNDYLSHHVSVQESVRPGVYLGTDYIEQLTASYGVSWLLTQRIGLTVDGSVEFGHQPVSFQIPGFFFQLSLPEDYNRYVAGPSVSWRATDHVNASLGYHYSLRDSSLPGRGYVVNDIVFNLSYTF